MPSGSVLSKEIDFQFVVGGLGEGVGDELGAERGAADADDEQLFERAAGAGGGALMHLAGE